MKEKRLSIKRILDTLSKKSFIEINPICSDCIGEIIPLILDVFCNVHFDVFQVEDQLYVLRISV